MTFYFTPTERILKQTVFSRHKLTFSSWNSQTLSSLFPYSKVSLSHYHTLESIIVVLGSATAQIITT